MNTPYRLFVNPANMTQERIQIIATENSGSTNGRQHLPEENIMLRYSTNNTRYAFMKLYFSTQMKIMESYI